MPRALIERLLAWLRDRRLPRDTDTAFQDGFDAPAGATNPYETPTERRAWREGWDAKDRWCGRQW